MFKFTVGCQPIFHSSELKEVWIEAQRCKLQETFSDPFGSYHLNGERRENDRSTEISLGHQIENASISHSERWGLAFPTSYPVGLFTADKEDGFPEAAQHRCFCVSLPGAHSADLLLANKTVCSACEQHVQANIHDLVYFLLCIKDTSCLRWFHKTQPRPVLPSIAYSSLENPTQVLPWNNTGTFQDFSRRVKM